MIIFSKQLTRLSDEHVCFIVSIYEDEKGGRYYMAWTQESGYLSGTSSDNPFDAIRELCDKLAELPTITD